MRVIVPIVFALLTGLGIWSTFPLWRGWYSVLRPQHTQTGSLGFQSASEQREVREAIRGSLGTQVSNVHISYLPSIVNTDLSDTDFEDQIRLLSDYSPPDADMFLPLWTRVSITEAYKLFLVDYFIFEESKLNLDSRSLEELNDLIRLYRQQGPVALSRAQRHPQPEQPLSNLLASFLGTHLSNASDFLQVVDALSRLPDVEDVDLPRTRLSTASLNWVNGIQLQYRDMYEGTGHFSTHDLVHTISADAPVTVHGAEYKFLPFQPPSWFNTSLLNKGERRAGLSTVRFERYFGPDGYLKRIPIGVLCRKLRKVEIEIEAQSIPRLSVLTPSTGQVSFDIGDLHFLLQRSDLTHLVKTGILELYPTPSRIRVAAVVSEVM